MVSQQPRTAKIGRLIQPDLEILREGSPVCAPNFTDLPFCHLAVDGAFAGIASQRPTQVAARVFCAMVGLNRKHYLGRFVQPQWAVLPLADGLRNNLNPSWVLFAILLRSGWRL